VTTDYLIGRFRQPNPCRYVQRVTSDRRVGHHQRVTRPGIRLALALALLAIAIGPAATVRAGRSPAKLPDLAMLPPWDFRIETNGGQRLLRFSTVQVNVGPGPFREYGYDEDGTADEGDVLSVVQWIRHEDRTWTQRDTTARMSWSGDGHDHWHVIDFQRFKLKSLDSELLGNAAKIGFCSFDSYPYTSPKRAFYTSERDICQTNSNGTVLMGTSRGWGDIYRWSIAFQWIDITGLPNGDYRLRVMVDPPVGSGGRFRESNESNNRSWAKIHIGTSSVTILDQSGNP
jgi:hypothetical protein